ncbi:phosphatase PAP2 family protein [Massilia sp. BJB1822]|uniref:phosphatase PAP2 family protein n=1 Tax=Massilia sp. BJB1822 TaxID=2744470 RepID=UPI001592D265|nr:phosphatase PAP2 family protein [Massilia sp. BJB1822]NVE00700.1 phosphatase PAP2 family protein [Massilia sp. BJB1822]
MVMKRMLVGTLCSLSTAGALAGNGPLGIDHRLGVDNDGIWSRRTQHIMLGTLITSEVLSGVWQGGDTRFGRTNWQSIDALLISAASTEVLKRTFRRVRPTNTDRPNAWFRSARDRSFPSGEAASFAAAVTPFILEYGHEQPWVYALAALPVYDGYARMKTRGHWQTDVLAGIAIGAATGWYAHSRHRSFTLQLMPHGVQVGLRGRF